MPDATDPAALERRILRLERDVARLQSWCERLTDENDLLRNALAGIGDVARHWTRAGGAAQ